MTILNRLTPSQHRLLTNIVVEHREQVRSEEFRDCLRIQLAEYNWKPNEIAQAMVEVQGIVDNGH